MNRILKTVIVVVGVVSCCQLATAQTADQKAAFRSADRNGSGAVSMEEFRNYAIGAFYHVDADHDGTVTPKEYAGVDEPVSVDDFNAAIRAHFEEYDADNGGSINMMEWAAVPSSNPAHPNKNKHLEAKETK